MALLETCSKGAMSSVMPTDNGNRCDFFFSKNFKEAVPQLIERCEKAVGEVYLQIANSDEAKKKIAEESGFTPCEKKDFIYNNCTIPTRIYRKD